MKKNFFLMAVTMIVLASCTTVTKTATTAKLPASFYNATSADLEVSSARITHTMYPSKAIRRGGISNVKQAVINEALQKADNADLLVEPEFVIEEKSGLFSGRKVRSITVSGRPAKYTGFHSLNDSVWCNPFFRGYKTVDRKWYQK